MREGQFIKRNIERWKGYQEETDDPDEVAKRFTYLVDDLAYAKTFYPFSNTVRYINAQAARIYLSIYQNKKEKSNRFATFWTTELPLIMRRNHRIMLYALIFFLVFVAIGIFSAHYDQTFIRSVLGDSYVDMTEQNIASGDPFGVYKQEEPFSMFVRIAYHNTRIAFLFDYLGGLFLSVGTIISLFANGLMLGSFEYMFFKHHLGFQSILTVFCHGTLEISAIVISGTAGFCLGNSILFPKTFTRLQSLKRGAKDGLKIVIGLVPVYITAAFFEGYVTRHTEMPIALSLLILAASLAFILWYFVFYPIKVARKLNVSNDEGYTE